MTKADDDILREAKARFKRAADWESAARKLYQEDIKFAEADADNGWQWPDDMLAGRQADKRPALTVNKVRQHCLQIINDARQNKAAMKFTPTGGGATYEAAQMYAGLARRIEYQSQATEAYEAATNTQVRGGWGYWRITTRYVDDGSFDQDIYIDRVPNPLQVYLDPDIQQFDGSDARFGFFFRDRPREEAERDHPKLKRRWSESPLGNDDGWIGEDHIREAEYYRVVDVADTLHLMADGSTMLQSDMGEDAPQSMRTRPVTRPNVEWFKIVGDEIVDREDVPFDFVPLVRVIGEETVIEGTLDRKGHPRAMKDAQRIYNYWVSGATETVALQTKAPWKAPAEAIEGYEEYWANANTENRAVLIYNHMSDAGQEIPAPQRTDPPVMPQAFVEGIQMADNWMMQVSGQYQAELGRQGNEKSGVAIQQRQRQADNATYHYVDHLAQAIRFTGRIIASGIPRVYDTARVLKIMGEDGEQSEITIDPCMRDAHRVEADPEPAPADPNGQPPSPAEQARARVKTFLNPAVGRYQVQADVGPSFGTQRQEAFNAFVQITSQNKELVPIIGDLMFKNADFPGADEIARRLQRVVPPQALGGPSPEVQQLQQHAQQTEARAKGLLTQADAKVASLQAQVVHLTEQAKDSSAKLEIDEYKAQTDRLQAVTQADPEVGKFLARSMLSDLLGAHALPVIHQQMQADAAHQQEIAPEPQAETSDA